MRSTKSFRGLSPLTREALGAWNLFRSCGYPAEEIFLSVVRAEEKSDFEVGITLCHKGNNVTIRIGYVDDREAFIADWKKASDVWNTAPAEERKELFDKSAAMRDAPTIVQKMLNRGLGATPSQIAERDSIH